METKILNFNGTSILCKLSHSITSTRYLRFKTKNQEYLNINSMPDSRKYSELFFYSSLENTLNFLRRNELEEIHIAIGSLNSFNKSINTDELIYISQILCNNNSLSLAFGISSENWKKYFSIKMFKEYVKIKAEEVKNTRLNIWFEILLNSLDKQLTLKEISDIYLEKLKTMMLEFEQETLPEKKLEFKVHEKFKTGIKQYIVYFNEYVERTKGITIDFEVENYSEGLVLKLNKNQNVEKIGEYFEEYMNFLRCEKIEDIQPIYEIERTEHDKKEDIMILRGEINDLRHKYERSQLLLNEKERYALKCEEETNNYRCIIQQLIQQNNQIFNVLQLSSNSFNPNIALTFNNNNINDNINNNTNTNTINFSQEVGNLQEDIERIKDFFKKLEIKEKEEELDEIDDEILEVSNPEDLKSKKKMFNKFKRIVNQINDENSTLNETIKAAKKGKECLEKIKLYIPTILTTISNLGEYFK